MGKKTTGNRPDHRAAAIRAAVAPPAMKAAPPAQRAAAVRAAVKTTQTPPKKPR